MRFCFQFLGVLVHPRGSHSPCIRSQKSVVPKQNSSLMCRRQGQKPALNPSKVDMTGIWANVCLSPETPAETVIKV